jgi:hypothetical protein
MATTLGGRLRRLAYLFGRPLAAEGKQEKPK